ncbi:MAG: sugar phosphate nucleotidyltransferase, partial [Acidimicrobiales bacterium]
GQDDFIMYLGDNLLQQGVAGLVDAFGTDGEGAVAHILLTRVPDPHRFGVAELGPTGEVVRLLEKPEVPPSDLALVGVYLFTPSIHEAVRAITPSARGELEITEAIQWLIDHGQRVHTSLLQGWWIDTGKLTPLLEANRLVLESQERRLAGTIDSDSTVEGRVVIEEGAVVTRSTIRGPVAIGAGARITESFIGPYTAIGAGCDVERSEIEHSIVLERSRIIGVERLEDSLIGRDVEVTRSKRRPRASRLMVGDHCLVDLG